METEPRALKMVDKCSWQYIGIYRLQSKSNRRVTVRSREVGKNKYFLELL